MSDVVTIYHRGGQTSVAIVALADCEMECARRDELDGADPEVDGFDHIADYIESVLLHPEKPGWRWIGDTLVHTSSISGVRAGFDTA